MVQSGEISGVEITHGMIVDDNSFVLVANYACILMVSAQKVISWQQTMTTYYSSLQISLLNSHVYWMDSYESYIHIGAVTIQGYHVFRSRIT